MYRCLGLRVKRDPPAAQSIDHLVSRQRAGARENLADRDNTAGSQVVVQSELRIPSGVRSDKDRAQQLNQPADVVTGDNVQGAAHEPTADDGPVVVERTFHVAGTETGAADTHAERRRAEDLRL